MKRLFATFASIALICSSLVVSAQDNSQAKKGQDHDWRDKMKAEKIAFLTDAMDLTSQEAEKFWPIYNKCEAEKREAFKATFSAFKELNEAIQTKKDDKTISRLLDRYLDSQDMEKEIDKKYLVEYQKILPAAKVANLYLGEEKFRRMQIHKLRGPGQANLTK